ncbi:MAG: ABC transporter substrate-binding protein, partial [Halanaerobiaceae bacterium]
EERDRAGEKIVKAQAENLWTIGTVGLPPQPVIVSNDLKNVPKKGLWDWTLRYMRPFYPIQFYLEE